MLSKKQNSNFLSLIGNDISTVSLLAYRFLKLLLTVKIFNLTFQNFKEKDRHK